MELGNMMFGNSRGQFQIKRSAGFEDELIRLFDACAPERNSYWREYGVDFENETFLTFPYYWGDCSCGYDERFDAANEVWSRENRHAADCYQTILHTQLEAYDKSIGYVEPGGSFFDHFYVDSEPLKIGVQAVGGAVMMTPIRDEAQDSLYDLHRKFEKKLYEELCAQFGLSRYGCAVHCTCDYEKKRAAWVATDGHASDCLLIRPNFLYKPTGFEIQWYKYPLRDAYMSEKLSLVKFSRIIDACIDSLKGQPSTTEFQQTSNAENPFV